jgi:prostaglandin reductase 3
MASFRKVQVHTLSPSFRHSTSVVACPVEAPGPGEVAIRVEWVGINASDINFSAGKYMPGLPPPFDAGFEALGRVVEVGEGVDSVCAGDAVAVCMFGAFAERLVAPASSVIPVPDTAPEGLAFLVSGLTASIALERVGECRPGDTVLVTAAAGATGLFACQLAKAQGCHVIGTCSSEDKVELLRALGVDRPVNYTVESLDSVLTEEYPRGVNVVYESVGGEMFTTALKHLAVRGRLIVIGFISGYSDGSGWRKDPDMSGATSPWPVQLLSKSASVRGFFLNHYSRDMPEHMARLAAMTRAGTLKPVIDSTSAAKFSGLEAIPDAIDYLYAKKNQGKVVVRVLPPGSTRESRL